MQSKAQSMIEQVLNVGSGYVLSVMLWVFVITPFFDIQTSLTENLTINATFTVVSVIRGYYYLTRRVAVYVKDT